VLPILLLAFCRRHELELVVNSILAQPHGDIYISVDGPSERAQEQNLEVSNYVLELSSCGILKGYRFSISNEGTLFGVSNGISWFFDQVESGIIIEDDLVLHDPILEIAELAFDVMVTNPNVLAINLRNTVMARDIVEPNAAFRYSRLISSHGWITTRENWSLFETSLNNRYRKLINFNLFKYFGFFAYLAFIQNLKKDIRLERISPLVANWDIRWQATLLATGKLTININQNLIEYIGFGAWSMHHKIKSEKKGIISIIQTPTNWQAPTIQDVDRKADLVRYRYELNNTFARFVVRLLKNSFRQLAVFRNGKNSTIVEVT